MTNATEPRELTLAMGAGDLLNMLGNTVLFASKDDAIPVLCTVKLSVKDQHVTAYATDRYRLARVKRPVKLVEGDWASVPHALMERSVVDAFVKLLKGEKHALKQNLDAHLIATVERDRVVSWRIMAGNSQSSMGQTVEAEFPRIESLFPDREPTDPAGMMAFNPAFLADMAKVKDLTTRDNEPLRLVGGSNSGKPASFYRYDWFEGLLMPVRLPVGSTFGNYNLAA